MLKLLTKSLVLLSILIAGYYFLIIAPQTARSNKLTQAELELTQHYSTLIENRLAYVELTRLNPESASFNLDKSNLVGTLQTTNEKGLEALSANLTLPALNQELTERFPQLLKETQQIYLRQNEILDQLFATESLESGVTVIKSDPSITLLTNQTNLILEYKYWIDTIQSLRNSD